MKRRIPDLDPPSRRQRNLTEEEKQLWQAEMQGKAKPAHEQRAKKRLPPAEPPCVSALKPLSPITRKTMTVLDLHGATQAVAHTMVARFLEQAQLHGVGTVRIITGKGGAKGEGILRTQLPRWLEETALRQFILGYDMAGPRQGGEGAWVIRIRKMKQ